MTALHIPDIDDDQDTLSAALAYARAGWYVLPVNRQSKHAGSVLGKGWPSKSSRDVETIISWFSVTDHALALHVGRSGAIVFDIDRPEAMPPLLRAALAVVPGPFQSTREAATQAERGHYLYSAPDGRILGNSAGTLGRGWGEVRGKNGIIVVAPSEHEKADEGGRYAWVRAGELPELPAVLADQLPDTGDASDSATDREIRTFLDRHTASARPELLHGVLTQFSTALATGESRHGIALRATAGAMREAAAGLYPALDAAAQLADAFTNAMAVRRDAAERILTPVQARAEYNGILAWAVAQVAAADLAAVREAVEERLPDDDFAGLIAPPTGAPEPPPFDRAAPAADLAAPTTEPTDGEELDLAALAFEREVTHELRKIRIREEAARRARKARAGTAPRPPITPLNEFLAVPDEPARYRVADLWPAGGRVVLAAQFKAGKTTMVGNLVRSLVDGTPFLGKYDVVPFTGRVVVLDDELDERMIRRWLRDQGIAYEAGAAVVSLRGRLSSFDLLDPQVRSEWAAALRDAGAAIVVLDCLAPILDSLGLSEDKEAGRFLVAFDELLKEAGVSEAIVIHHMGHSGERSRGASRLRDWPDVEWRLVREKSEDGEMDPAAPRYFSAYGRDVDVPESRLTFETTTRHLEIAGGSRKNAAADRIIDEIREFLTLRPGAPGAAIEAALGEEHGRNNVRKAVARAVELGAVRRVPGRGNAILHYLNDAFALSPSSPPARHPGGESNRVNNVSPVQHSSPQLATPAVSISENDHSAPPSSPGGWRAETPGHSVDSPGSPQLATSVAASSPVGPPYGGRPDTGELPAATHDPLDPSDLLPPTPAEPLWIEVDGQRVDPATGEILDPGGAP